MKRVDTSKFLMLCDISQWWRSTRR